MGVGGEEMHIKETGADEKGREKLRLNFEKNIPDPLMLRQL